MEMTYIDDKLKDITVDDQNHLAVEFSDGRQVTGVLATRLFPFTRKNRFIRLADPDGQELGIIAEMKSLNKPHRQMLHSVLEQYYLIPKITEIYHLTEEYGISRWDVNTNRGRRTFEVKSRNSDITAPKDGVILIRDSNGNRYEISNVNALPESSRALLENEF